MKHATVGDLLKFYKRQNPGPRYRKYFNFPGATFTIVILIVFLIASLYLNISLSIDVDSLRNVEQRLEQSEKLLSDSVSSQRGQQQLAAAYGAMYLETKAERDLEKSLKETSIEYNRQALDLVGFLLRIIAENCENKIHQRKKFIKRFENGLRSFLEPIKK